jgi:hypothetical protein
MNKNLIVPSLITLSGTIVLSVLKALWGPRMAAFAWEVFVSSWVVLLPALAALIWWNIQFFRNYKRDKDAEFRSWLQEQNKTVDRGERKRNEDIAGLKQTIHDYFAAEAHMRRVSEMEARMLALEQTISQKDQDK